MMNEEDLGQQSQNQQQTIGDIQVQGDDNCFSIIQGDAVTFNQTCMIQVLADAIKTRKLITISPYKSLRPFEPGKRDRSSETGFLVTA